MDHTTKNIGSTMPVHTIKTYVVYDEASGRIYHHHSVLTLVGGREPSEEEMSNDALRALRHQQTATAPKLQVLRVAHDALQPGQRYRVNHAARALVPGDATS
jgi:hypothetical protein